ncbi:Rubrerythrin [bioreactor metagenome]|uniref:Rubrerythrin n=1 Tax=bioreactor metagenome TaxID=1076179 RepID=A0A645FUF2_9ZZZZ
MYKEMAATAHEEGFHVLGDTFEAVAKIEKSHEERYLKLAENMEDGVVFQRGEIKVWYCRNCGHLEYGTEAPAVCPVCGHPQSYFELHADNY